MRLRAGMVAAAGIALLAGCATPPADDLGISPLEPAVRAPTLRSDDRARRALLDSQLSGTGRGTCRDTTERCLQQLFDPEGAIARFSYDAVADPEPRTRAAYDLLLLLSRSSSEPVRGDVSTSIAAFVNDDPDAARSRLAAAGFATVGPFSRCGLASLAALRLLDPAFHALLAAAAGDPDPDVRLTVIDTLRSDYFKHSDISRCRLCATPDEAQTLAIGILDTLRDDREEYVSGEASATLAQLAARPGQTGDAARAALMRVARPHLPPTARTIDASAVPREARNGLLSLFAEEQRQLLTSQPRYATWITWSPEAPRPLAPWVAARPPEFVFGFCRHEDRDTPEAFDTTWRTDDGGNGDDPCTRLRGAGISSRFGASDAAFRAFAMRLRSRRLEVYSIDQGGAFRLEAP